MATASTAEAPEFQLSGSRQGSRKAGQGGSKGQGCSSSISTVASVLFQGSQVQLFFLQQTRCFNNSHDESTQKTLQSSMPDIRTGILNWISPLYILYIYIELDLSTKYPWTVGRGYWYLLSHIGYGNRTRSMDEQDCERPGFRHPRQQPQKNSSRRSWTRHGMHMMSWAGKDRKSVSWLAS